MSFITDYDHGISAVDSGYGRPRLAAIHLVVERGRAAVVDTATNACVPRVLEALGAKGLTPEAVDYVFLTHVHLDHAGAAGTLMQCFPNARLAVHPRGARHMADPSKLVAGTVGVYGEAATRAMYGEIKAVPAERIVETPDETVLTLGGREFVFLDTPGHARHHACILDTRSGRIFSGDTFGLSYRELDRDGLQFIFPTTTPVQFDPDALHRSVDRLLALHPDAIYVTHYSEVRDIPRLGADLHRSIDAHAQLGLREKDADDRDERLRAGVWQILEAEAARYRWPVDDTRLRTIFAMDVKLNAQGIASWLGGR